MAIGNRLKTLRTEQNKTLGEVAEYLGVDKRTIQHYESDARKPDYEKLVKLADLYGVSTDYLLGRTDKK